jgi:ZIP family zinc transporter
MIYVSFVEILAKAQELLVAYYGGSLGEWVTTGSFFLGILIIGLIDRIVPEYENPHEPRSKDNLKLIKEDEVDEKMQLKRMVFF